MKYAPFFPVLMTAFVIAGCAGKSPRLGIEDGRLKPCPDSPNCVNSQAAPADDHFIEPLAYAGTRAEARQRLLEIINETPRTRIIDNREDYIRVEFKSRLFRFVDDVEFYFPDEPLIQVRSASRVGYSDLGVNRRRIESIRERFTDSER